jgi:hypothetical protein
VHDLRVGSEPVKAEEFDMAYIFQRNHASTSSPTRASTRSPDGIVAADIPLIVAARTPRRSSPDWRSTRRRVANARAARLTVGSFLFETWLPHRRRELRPTTAKRYEWIIHNYIAPLVGGLLVAHFRL